VIRKGYSVIKRISLLIVAALMAAMMMVATAAPAFADPQNKCDRDPTFKQCEKFGPGESENTPAFGKNPNTGVERDNPSPNN
jgi:hypothetical protein